MTLKLVAIDGAVRYSHVWCGGRLISAGAIMAVATSGDYVHYICHSCTKKHMRAKRVEAEVSVALLSSASQSICVFDGLPSTFYSEFERPICRYDVFVVKAPVRRCAQYGPYSICFDGETFEAGVKIEDVTIPYRVIVALNQLAHEMANEHILGLWHMATSRCVVPTGAHPSMVDSDVSIY